MDCQFVRTDVYEIAREYDNQFDMLYISTGGLGWLHDLPLFFTRATALLRTGGSLFIDEIYPFVEMLPHDELADADPLRIIESYIKTEPYIEVGGLDYVGKQTYAASAPQYWFIHTMSSIIMGMVNAGLAITNFSEYERDVSTGHQGAQHAHAGVPLIYILIGTKGG